MDPVAVLGPPTNAPAAITLPARAPLKKHPGVCSLYGCRIPKRYSGEAQQIGYMEPQAPLKEMLKFVRRFGSYLKVPARSFRNWKLKVCRHFTQVGSWRLFQVTGKSSKLHRQTVIQSGTQAGYRQTGPRV